MKFAVGTLVAALALSVSFTLVAQAEEQVVQLNRENITVNNRKADGSYEAVTLQRDRHTPEKITIQMNPVTKYSTVCVDHESYNQCGHSSLHCGSYPGHTRTVCSRERGSDGVYRDHCREVYEGGGPLSCCWTDTRCVRHESIPYEDYEDFKIKFKDNTLDEGQIDVLQLVPVDRKKVELRVIQSKRPYMIKKKGLFSKDTFELRQEMD